MTFLAMVKFKFICVMQCQCWQLHMCNVKYGLMLYGRSLSFIIPQWPPIRQRGGEIIKGSRSVMGCNRYGES